MVKTSQAKILLAAKCQRFLSTLAALSAAACVGVPLSSATAEPRTLCSHMHELIEEARTQFSAIRGEFASEFGGYGSTHTMLDAHRCILFEDVEKASHQCTWQYPLGDPHAHTAFKGFVEETKDCLTGIATARMDQPVNHPDYYAAYYFLLPKSEINISLKNKSALSATVISIRIDALTQPR